MKSTKEPGSVTTRGIVAAPLHAFRGLGTCIAEIVTAFLRTLSHLMFDTVSLPSRLQSIDLEPYDTLVKLDIKEFSNAGTRDELLADFSAACRKFIPEHADLFIEGFLVIFEVTVARLLLTNASPRALVWASQYPALSWISFCSIVSNITWSRHSISDWRESRYMLDIVTILLFGSLHKVGSQLGSLWHNDR